MFVVYTILDVCKIFFTHSTGMVVFNMLSPFHASRLCIIARDSKNFIAVRAYRVACLSMVEKNNKFSIMCNQPNCNQNLERSTSHDLNTAFIGHRYGKEHNLVEYLKVQQHVKGYTEKVVTPKNSTATISCERCDAKFTAKTDEARHAYLMHINNSEHNLKEYKLLEEYVQKNKNKPYLPCPREGCDTKLNNTSSSRMTCLLAHLYTTRKHNKEEWEQVTAMLKN